MSGKTTSANSALALLTAMLFSFALLISASRPLFAQTGTQSSQSPSPSSSTSLSQLPTSSSSPTTSATQSQEQVRSAALQQYREVLENERKILEDQSKEYYARVQQFAYISLTTLGAAFIGLIAFLKWMFGQTRTEVVSQLKADLQNSVLSSAREELDRFKREKIEPLDSEYQRLKELLGRIASQYQSLKEQLDRINSFGKQQVIWLLRDNMPKPEGEIAALHSVGLTHVTTTAPKVDAEDEIKEVLKPADLAIITFDGSPEAKSLLRHASTALKFRQPPISLLIYTYGFYANDRTIQLDRDDLKHLKDLSSFAPANFPATLVSQAQSLIIKTRAVV